MRNKDLIIGAVLIAVIIGIVVVAKPLLVSKKPAEKKEPAVAVKGAKKPATPPAPAKKALPKDKGVLTVKLADSNKKDMAVRIRAFRSVDSRSSVLEATFMTNKPAELLPGTYDLELDTIPQKIYKNVKVVKEKEQTENPGAMTGSLIVKALNAQRKDAVCYVRVLQPKGTDAIASVLTNKPLELLPGVYNLDIGTIPRQLRKDVKVELGKQTAVDLGCQVGVLLVKALDAENKPARYNARVARSDNKEYITNVATNQPSEIMQGTYNVEIYSVPRQEKKDVKITAGEETAIEFIVPPSPPARK